MADGKRRLGVAPMSFHKAGDLGNFLQEASSSGSWGKKHRSEDDYFNGDSDGEQEEGGGSEELLRQQLAEELQGDTGGGVSEDEDDPLDAFMAGIQTEVARQNKTPAAPKKQEVVRFDIDGEDDQESYFTAMANAPIVVAEGDDDIEIDYDSDGYPIIPERSKVIDPLPPLDHSAVEYRAFNRNFYTEHPDITALSNSEVKELKKTLGLKVTGFSPPRPCVSFAHFGFDEALLSLIRKSEFAKPTGIQSQAVPVVTSGRDVIGIAKTGSGKTAAFLWPLLMHAIDQREIKEGDGPIGLICTPTRELCQQIYHEARRFAKAYNLTVTCVYGGGSKWEQCNTLKEGCEILVATPGRLIDLVKLKATNLQRVTYLVFDEADRMFDMGFEAQVRSIANHVRPDRQTLLFSATFRKKVERLARDVLTDPVRIVVGDLGEANTDITQIVEVVKDEQEKWRWLLRRLVELTSAGSVLVFVTRKANSEQVATSLKTEGFSVGLLHGDMAQGDRDTTISSFKRKEFPILIATDVASRGLDISSIKTVVNFDVAKNIDTHVHRIGRTGRAGEKGTAYTLITHRDAQFAGDLVRNMEVADQRVPEELIKLAMTNTRFQRSRQKHGNKGGGSTVQRSRQKLRPGLGSTQVMFSRPSAAVAPPSSLGPMGSSGRSSIIKQTYLASYKTKFQQASGCLASTSSLGQPVKDHTPSEQPPPSKRKRKSRWN
ncbi:ATP-dependent RNA helicase DDX42-like [Halichondria panicea]|uniref:ATP-dependent RNA helicase DDX42-like n=1 Tax=Halichondria panicea TaxID=6063 RepID=UPI00312B2F6A